jgi:DNA-binding transcriptional ArsR family regulator
VSGEKDQAVFLALADPTRRALIARLSQVEAETASNLARRFPITRQAISKHFAVLEEAGLVTSQQVGRERRYKLNPEPLGEANDWLDAISSQWDRRLDRLKDILSDEGE